MADIGDDWFESEESMGRGMVSELQRIRRRTRARPVMVLLIAALITGAIYMKISRKKPLHEANVVLALTEESLSTENRKSIPVDQLRDYVVTVLLPAKELAAMIEKRNLYPLRKKQGLDFAIGSLFEQTEIAIWKNSFVNYDQADAHALRSARIGITVIDTDPDLAFGIARDLAQIIIHTSAQQRLEVAAALSSDVARVRKALEQRQTDASKQIATTFVALTTARRLGKVGLAQGIELDLANLVAEQKRISGQLATVLTSRDSIAERISAAGLDMSVEVVEESPPDRTQPRAFVMVLIMTIVGFGALFGTALVVGAFDPRVHDTEDIERLGLPVLGHVPGFRGDHVGSLEARGARASRVPSFLRWRSHR
jgi:hypothetical protein